MMTLTPPGGPLLDLAEAAQYLHKTERWMRRAFSERRLPTVKVGRSVLVRRADLDDLIESGYRPANGSAAPPGPAASPRVRSKRPPSLPDRTRALAVQTTDPEQPASLLAVDVRAPGPRWDRRRACAWAGDTRGRGTVRIIRLIRATAPPAPHPTADRRCRPASRGAQARRAGRAAGRPGRCCRSHSAGCDAIRRCPDRAAFDRR